MPKLNPKVRSVIQVLLLAGTLALPLVAEQTNSGHVSRDEAIEAARFSESVFDCLQGSGTAVKSESPKIARVFDVGPGRKIEPPAGRNFTTGFWSPSGKAILFVAPTNQLIEVTGVLKAASEESQLVGISRNELWLFNVAKSSWVRVTDNGRNPRFSKNGQYIYYFSGGDLVAFDANLQSARKTGISVPTTTEGLLQSSPLSNGTFVGFKDSTGRIEESDSNQGEDHWTAIELDVTDRLAVSPGDGTLVISYGTRASDLDAMPTLALYPRQGKGLPILRNCSVSAPDLSWSPDGRELAVPLKSTQSTIGLFDLASSSWKTVVSFSGSEMVSGVSFSPDRRHLAFARGSLFEGSASIWIISHDGAIWQQVVRGGLPKWSLDGAGILYATLDRDSLLEWNLVTLKAIDSEAGK